MTKAASSPRAFTVRARHVDAHHARLVSEPTALAAAIAYVEDFHPWDVGEARISVIVRDVETGHEHCFRLDLESGRTAPCP